MTVTEFVRHKVLPEHRGIVAAIRRLVRETAPDAKEVIAYDTLGWKRKEIFAVINPTKKDITFVFLRGAEFEDKYGVLQGSGKVQKYIKINYTGVNPVALRYYVRQAVKLDKK